ncbi:MAG: FAD binding domain-containing protein [Anaerolineales bacterium]
MLRPFEIHEPGTVEEASVLLAQFGFDAAFYAGGTELLLVMKEGLAHYAHLVNIKTIPGLDEIALSTEGDELQIGPLATHWELERSPSVRKHALLLAEVESQVANARVRVMGTIGGNLCFAEPHSDLATLLLAWGATLELSSAEAQRQLPAADFTLGMFETAKQPDEILTRIRLPLLSENTAGAYRKFSTHERPMATVAALLQVKNGIVEEARLAVGSVGPVPIRASEAEALLRGQGTEEATFASAAELAASASDPADDPYGSAGYKRHLVRVLTTQALVQAAVRATGEPNEG